MLIYFSLAMTIGLVPLHLWGNKHILQVGPSSLYYPHPSHFIAWAYIATNVSAFVFCFVWDRNTLGAAFLLLFSGWQYFQSFRFLRAFLKRESLTM